MPQPGAVRLDADGPAFRQRSPVPIPRRGRHRAIRKPAVRITYVTETFPPEINGVSLSAARAVAFLRDAGHAVQLVRPRQPGERASDTAGLWLTAGGPIPMYRDLRFGLARAAAFRQRWQRHGAPDLVHVATPGPLGLAALRAARAQGVATSADFRTNFHAYSHHYRLGWLEPLVLGYLKRLHARADCNFVPTAQLARELAGQGFERLEVVGRGVDAQRFSPVWRDPALRQQWNARPQDPVLLHVGRLAAEKNVGLALQVFEQLRLVNPAVRMVVVGDGPQRQALQRAHPLARFVGVQTGAALARHYASADVFLFPSLTDTFGNVVLEALASGLAVVAYDTAAAAAHIRDRVSGCLAALPAGRQAPAGAAPARAVETFQTAARRALLHAAPGSALRLQALRAARRADWNVVLRGFEQQLRAVAGQAGPPLSHAAVA